MESTAVPGSLFADTPQPPSRDDLATGVVLLRGHASGCAHALLESLAGVVAAAPLRHMLTPGGRVMSVRNTNAGALGWVSDRRGYRYVASDPRTGRQWPPMPASWLDLACLSAMQAGFGAFVPDACLVNVYAPGTRLSLHQDRDEHDFSAPIVSVSLGLPATFLLGGSTRGAPVRRVPLLHGDVLVWGGPARMAYHGVAALPEGTHPLLGRSRVNLTFRKAG